MFGEIGGWGWAGLEGFCGVCGVDGFEDILKRTTENVMVCMGLALWDTRGWGFFSNNEISILG